jgi:hypothetical protein
VVLRKSHIYTISPSTAYAIQIGPWAWARGPPKWLFWVYSLFIVIVTIHRDCCRLQGSPQSLLGLQDLPKGEAQFIWKQYIPHHNPRYLGEALGPWAPPQPQGGVIFGLIDKDCCRLQGSLQAPLGLKDLPVRAAIQCQ